MESSSSPSLLQRFRNDRRKLLNFILSSTSHSSSVDADDSQLDNLSVDYVIDCLKSGGKMDVSQGIKQYYAESSFPPMIHSKLGDSYFLLSNTDLVGSPPRHSPPPITLKKVTADAPHPSSNIDPLTSRNVGTSGNGTGVSLKVDNFTPLTVTKCVTVFSLGLPPLKSGLSDDDLRESAYEILLASIIYSGTEIQPVEYKKKEKATKLLSGLKNKKDKASTEIQFQGERCKLIDTVCVQMQISEKMDSCIRKRLVPFSARNTCEKLDIPQIALDLLNGILRSDFQNEKSYVQWKNRQANILEEFLCLPLKPTTSEWSAIKSAIAKIRDTEEWDNTMTATERAGVLSDFRRISSERLSVPGKFGILGESYYWTASYHVNIRLYERLLFGLFDTLEEGQLVSEAEDMLKLIKLTWSILGITEEVHNALYAWVLFQRFIETDEATLLDQATIEVKKVLFAEDSDLKERLYINSLLCSTQWNDVELNLSLPQMILLLISIWCDNQLQDYHLRFHQKPSNFSMVVNLASQIGLLTSGENVNNKLLELSHLDGIALREVKQYVERSIKSVYRRVADTVNLESKRQGMHPLALLANELKLVAEREFTLFCPILCQWHPGVGAISASLLHQLYGDNLKLFLKEVSCLSEEVRSVLPAAYRLEFELTFLYTSMDEDLRLLHDLDPYKIGEVSKPIIVDWLIAQHGRILEWTARAFDLEDWEPLSSQKRQATSIVEVFRIIEETVDQLFGLNLPLDSSHIQALVSVIFHSLDTYIQKMVDQLVERKTLIPTNPALTRYDDSIISVIKKKWVEGTVMEENVIEKLNALTIPKLCIRLNTLQYIHKQLNSLEDGIKGSWAITRKIKIKSPKALDESEREESPKTTDLLECNESIEELFMVAFNSIREAAYNAINKICDFIGERAVFWDLKDSFLSQLYRGDVEGARLENILPHFDTILDKVCTLVDEILRDHVVLDMLRASLEGFIWVLLNGGPSRAFSDSDVTMMEEDLNALKDFFIADGEGLPRSLVEQESKVAGQILSVFSLQTETVIDMLMVASEQISMSFHSPKPEDACIYADAHTLIRVLCHKKDREASIFLKKHYQLPTSAEYDDTPSGDSSLMSDLLKRSTSIRWAEKGQSSLKSMKDRLQKATSEIWYTSAW